MIGMLEQLRTRPPVVLVNVNTENRAKPALVSGDAAAESVGYI